MTCTKTIRKPNSSNFLNHRKTQTSQAGQQKEKGLDPHYYSLISASLEKKEKQGVTCTKTIAKTNSSNFPKPSKSIGLKSLYS